jgi:6-phosphogluconolactonase
MPTTARRLAFALLAACLVTPVVYAAEAESWRVYIGTYTRGDSEGIYQLELNAETGALSATDLAAATENPSFLALHPELPVLYAVGEMAAGGTVSAFAVDPASGELSLLNAQSSEGPGPCHVAVSPGGSLVAVANYSGGNVALLPVGDDGSLEAATAVMQHEGSSVHPRQQAPHAHSVIFDASGAYLFAADLGIDKMMSYRVDAGANPLAPNEPPHAALAPGAGPRHFVFHPAGEFAYAVNELDNTVTAFAYDADTGALTTIHSAGTLPADFDGQNTTAEIRVHPSGRFLYASNRGHDSIAAFAIDEASGRITPIGQTSTQGQTPRNFNLDPSGKWLLAANQASDTVVVYSIDPDTGTLTPTGHSLEVPTPVCVLFVPAGHAAAE